MPKIEEKLRKIVKNIEKLPKKIRIKKVGNHRKLGKNLENYFF